MTDLDTGPWGAPGLSARLAVRGDERDDALPPHERARAAGFALASRAVQFRLGRTAARTLAAERLGLSATAVPLLVGADGAPEVAGLSVSIAHTGGPAAALAAVADGPVGVDVERVAPRRPDLWTRITRDDERPLLDALGGPTDEAQTLLWTLKESVLKAQRTGFRAAARSVRLALSADGAAPDAGLATAASAAGDWRLAFGRDGDLRWAVAWADGAGGGS